MFDDFGCVVEFSIILAEVLLFALLFTAAFCILVLIIEQPGINTVVLFWLIKQSPILKKIVSLYSPTVPISLSSYFPPLFFPN